MQKSVLFLIVLVFLGCANKPESNGNENKTSIPSESTTIEFTEKMHNFGELTAGEIVLHNFEFTNTGNNDYWIEQVVSDCACVNTYFKKEVVKPGQKGRIEIEFNSAGTAGREYKTIEIYGNSKELKHLAIFAEVKNKQIEIKY